MFILRFFLFLFLHRLTFFEDDHQSFENRNEKSFAVFCLSSKNDFKHQTLQETEILNVDNE